MKQYFSIIPVIFMCVLLLVPYQAFSEDSPFGLGIMLGEPTGISAKHWLTGSTAIDGGMAWSFADETRMHVHCDWLMHNFSILADEFDIDKGKMPLYYGIGGRLKFDDDTRAGVRFVIGVAYMFEKAPFDMFFEIAPVMDIAPETELAGNAFLGGRFWFK